MSMELDAWVKRTVYKLRISRPLRKRNAREKKRRDIETRQVARAYLLAGKCPPIIHNGKVPR